MKIHAFRLTKGMDLKKSIEDYVVEHNIKSGVILSGVGCVYKAVLRTADGVTVVTLDNHYEIVSVTGTLSSVPPSINACFFTLHKLNTAGKLLLALTAFPTLISVIY